MAKKPQINTINQTANGNDNIQVVGNNNIITRITNFFAGDKETVDQRNRRIMLGHVENFWVKGILEKSLHGAALLDLGIKEDPDALTYPWAIKREANKETLPAGTSMLEIFQEIGMGRSLFILGAPGSGKTTMLLELTRQLIERAREDVTEPIPVVFNLSSWTEKLTLADWLARELNVIYAIPKKVAPTWVKENRMLLLLDGLDEVRQESRDKCVDAINQFRKENGLTSMGVCSRIQNYAELKSRLSFEGAIEIQPLTSNQVDDYFKHFEKGLAGIRQILKKDTVLHEMAETPLFLSIMTLAYRDRESKDIFISGNLDRQRKHLFDAYIERMFERPERSKNENFNKKDVLSWLSWLARMIIEHNAVPYLLENMQPKWLSRTKPWIYRIMASLIGGVGAGLIYAFIHEVMYKSIGGFTAVLVAGLVYGMIFSRQSDNMVDAITWNWKKAIKGLIIGMVVAQVFGFIIGINLLGESYGSGPKPAFALGLYINIGCVVLGPIFGLIGIIFSGLKAKPINQTGYAGQRISNSFKNSFFVSLLTFLMTWLIFSLIYGLTSWFFYVATDGLSSPSISDWLVWVRDGCFWALIFGLIGGLMFGGIAIVQHYLLRFILSRNNLLPWKLIPFLDHCVDLIFLRRVGGGYIFVHRLLMEHFAAMYPEET